VLLLGIGGASEIRLIPLLWEEEKKIDILIFILKYEIKNISLTFFFLTHETVGL